MAREDGVRCDEGLLLSSVTDLSMIAIVTLFPNTAEEPMLARVISVPVVAFALTTASPFAASRAYGQQPIRKLELEQYLDMESVNGPGFSPDGRQILYTRSYVDKMNDKRENALWLMNSDGTKNRFLVKGSGAKWSPDGTRLAYIAPGEPSGAQIFVRWMDAEGATSQITHLTQAPSALEWSPDGKSIAFQSFVPKSNLWAVKQPTPPKGAKWTEPPRVVQRINFQDSFGVFTEDGFRHIFVVSADGGTPKQVTTGDCGA